MARKPTPKRRNQVERVIAPEELTPLKIGSEPRRSGWQPGNSFWKARSKHGRDKIFSSPEILREACEEYFTWVEANPMPEAKAFAYEGAVTIETIPKMRVMTIGSLTLFLDITEKTWWEYAKLAGFGEICEAVGKTIREQKFAGATSGFFNHAIIARDLGLVDKKELSGPGGGPIQTQNRNITTEMSAKEAAEAYAEELKADSE